jgi:hypothetical protein
MPNWMLAFVGRLGLVVGEFVAGLRCLRKCAQTRKQQRDEGECG